MSASVRSFDVAVIGAGPVGCVAALTHARRGARVLLLEANPRASGRLAGEWLHPPALALLGELGVELPGTLRHAAGRGFAVFPDTDEAPALLPYAGGSRGAACEHRELVAALRSAASSHPDVLAISDARVTRIDGQRLDFCRRGRPGPVTVSAGLLVGADGRASVARAALGLPTGRTGPGCMAGLLLTGIELPFEGFGHVFLGGPGPTLAYRIGPERVRLCLDLPHGTRRNGERRRQLFEEFAAALPPPLRRAFRAALERGPVQWAPVDVRPRVDFGRPGLALVGDAVGHPHPLTAAGLSLGFADAARLAEGGRFEAYRRSRRRESRVPDLLASLLYEVFADTGLEASEIRRSVFALWHRSPAQRRCTMRYLAGEDRRLASFSRSFLQVLLETLGRLARESLACGSLRQGLAVGASIASRAASLTGFRAPRRAAPSRGRRGAEPTPIAPAPAAGTRALSRAVGALERHQQASGAWEGEVAWCPLLAAQYVMTCHVIGSDIPGERRRRLVQQFRHTRRPDGLWGLHELSPPYLFVTTLVYVAARLLGVSADDPLLTPARNFFRREGGVVGIPSWGKFWLAMLGLYEWRGVNPVLPELWALPRALPLHPSRFYCHTRLIYLAMGVIFARKLVVPPQPLLAALREELFPGGWDEVDFDAARTTLRSDEVHTLPSVPLQLIFRLAGLYDRFHRASLRRRVVADGIRRIRWELASTDYTSLSPVNGLLNMIALWSESPDDPDLSRALERFEGWIWEDDREGVRVAGARSASWDTAFALRGLAAAAPHVDVAGVVARGTRFLRAQQIRESFPGYPENDRIDPKGGWCFAGVWHGWPVSDCTAEALAALGAGDPRSLDPEALRDGTRFVLRCQNPDGGFGSYEAQRTRLDLEAINPAEMFGDSMSDHSWVECTASCVEALAGLAGREPLAALRSEMREAVARGALWLRRHQHRDGSWEGAWGVHFVYGTLFGIRGLRAAGAPATDPALRRACRWLLDRQRADGGWGESPEGCLSGRYRENPTSQSIHTAWALLALLEARDPEWRAIERGAAFLVARQQADGQWPREEPAGVFFHTALLDYALYRCSFPAWALAAYETRRRERLDRAQPALAWTRFAAGRSRQLASQRSRWENSDASYPTSFSQESTDATLRSTTPNRSPAR